jgi:Asp/Glu/hydantoin racemase
MTTVIGWVSPISGFGPAEIARRDGIVSGYLPPGFRIEFMSSASDAPQWLDAHQDFADAITAEQAYFATIDPERYDLVIAAGGIDPGLPGIRAASRVPVVGPGEASMYLASVVGKPTTVLGVDEYAIAAITPFLEQIPAKPPIVSLRSLDTPVREIMQDMSRGEKALRRVCESAVHDDGAEAIYLGCMTLGSFGMAEDLQQHLGVPVFDPVRIAVAAAVQIGYGLNARPREAG